MGVGVGEMEGVGDADGQLVCCCRSSEGMGPSSLDPVCTSIATQMVFGSHVRPNAGAIVE